MNTVYALIIISSLNGVQEAYRFETLSDCLATRTAYQEQTGNKAQCVQLTVRQQPNLDEVFDKILQLKNENN